MNKNTRLPDLPLHIRSLAREEPSDLKESELLQLEKLQSLVLVSNLFL